MVCRMMMWLQRIEQVSEQIQRLYILPGILEQQMVTITKVELTGANFLGRPLFCFYHFQTDPITFESAPLLNRSGQ
jgi:hypothetical protein